MLKMQTKKQGFTLIELLVVIVIIGILATIAIPQFTSYFAKARDSERKATVSTLATLVKVAVAGDSSGNITYQDLDGDTIPDTDSDVANKLKDLAADAGYSIPSKGTAYKYYYFVDDTDNEFAIAVCLEEDGQQTEVASSGTAKALNSIGGCDADDHVVNGINGDIDWSATANMIEAEIGS